VGGRDRGHAPHPQVVRGPHQLLDSGSAMGCATRPRTVGRWLECLGISRRRDLDPTSMPDRVPEVFPAHYQGHMMTWMSRKSVGSPQGAGGTFTGGAPTQPASRREGGRAKRAYLHSMIDGFSRLAPPKPSTTRGQPSRKPRPHPNKQHHTLIQLALKSTSRKSISTSNEKRLSSFTNSYLGFTALHMSKATH